MQVQTSCWFTEMRLKEQRVKGAENMIPDMCERRKEKCTIKDLGTFWFVVQDIGQPKGKLIIFQILCSNLCMSRGQDLHTLQTRLEVKTLLAEEHCIKDSSWITKEKTCHNIKFISTHSQRHLIRSSKICLQSVTSKHTFDEMANVTRIKIQMWRIYTFKHTLICCRSH